MRKVSVLAIMVLLVLPGVLISASGQAATSGPVVTISKWGHAPLPVSNDTEIFKLVEQKLKAKLGFDVQFQIMGSEAGVTEVEKENLLLASGDLPDILDVWWNEKMMAEGTARMEVSDLQKWMPLTYASLTGVMKDLGLDETLTWDRYKRNGKLVQIPNVAYEASIPVGIAWRKDLLDKWGMQVPKTLPEFEAAFKRFKQEFPDLYPYGGMGGEGTFASFSAVIGGGPFSPWHWYVRDGKLVYGAVQPEYKQTLKVLADWWQKGYIDPESTVINGDTHWNLFYTGKRLMIDWVGWDAFTTKPYLPGSVGDLLTKQIPTAEIAPGPYPVVVPGLKPSKTVWFPFHGGSYAFGRQLEKDPDKLHKVMQVMMYLLQDKDIYYTHQYGILGKTYDMVDGVPTLRPEYISTDAKTNLGIGLWWVSMYDYAPFWGKDRPKPPKVQEAYDKYYASPNAMYGRNNLEAHFKANIDTITDENGLTLETKYPDLANENAHADLTLWQIMTGKKPLSAFDDWVAYWNNNGGKEFESNANRLNLHYWVKK